jgi:hypothetical protein
MKVSQLFEATSQRDDSEVNLLTRLKRIASEAKKKFPRIPEITAYQHNKDPKKSIGGLVTADIYISLGKNEKFNFSDMHDDPEVKGLLDMQQFGYLSKDIEPTMKFILDRVLKLKPVKLAVSHSDGARKKYLDPSELTLDGIIGNNATEIRITVALSPEDAVGKLNVGTERINITQETERIQELITKLPEFTGYKFSWGGRIILSSEAFKKFKKDHAAWWDEVYENGVLKEYKDKVDKAKADNDPFLYGHEIHYKEIQDEWYQMMVAQEKILSELRPKIKADFESIFRKIKTPAKLSFQFEKPAPWGGRVREAALGRVKVSRSTK